MAGITLAQAQAMLDAYIAAETAILSGQSYRIGDRMMTKADHASVVRERAKWEGRVLALSEGRIGGAIRFSRAAPR